jgi:murein DD-endopeptidase MepM/ murein hydrolase activator NlpD
VFPSAAAAALLVTATGATVAESAPAYFDLTGAVGQVRAEDAAAAQLARIDLQQQREVQAAAVLARVAQSQRIARSAERSATVKQKATSAASSAALAAAGSARLKSQAWVLPIKGGIFTSGFGWRWGRLHEGNDFACPVGTPVAAMSSGTVITTGYEDGYGNMVAIRYWDGTVSVFAHLSQINTAVGSAVTTGQLVALSGNTGHSTGPHLHLEIHPNGGPAINPAPWLHDHGLQ